jgi:hypothetical protein
MKYRAQQKARGRVFEFATQVVDINIDDVGGLGRLHVPYGVEQLNPGDALAAIQHQVDPDRLPCKST